VHERGEAPAIIVRTASEGASEEDLRADLRSFCICGQRSRALRYLEIAGLIYHDLSLIERI